MTFVFSGWFGFWLMVIVYVLCEAWLTSKGIDTVLWRFKTKPEKDLQKKLAEKA